MWKHLPALMAMLLGATPAHACRVPKVPIDPALVRSDVILVGRVFDVSLNDQIQGKWFSVKVEAVVAGKFADSSYRTGWATGPGACGPTGPDVAEGDQVAVYFRYMDGKRVEQGWTKIPSK
jgi:hypothetical protein